MDEVKVVHSAIILGPAHCSCVVAQRRTIEGGVHVVEGYDGLFDLDIRITESADEAAAPGAAWTVADLLTVWSTVG
jgi:hypothetical protein